MKMTAEDNHFFMCQCISDEHTVRVYLDPDDGEICISVQMLQYRNIFQRIVMAVKYVFNRAGHGTHGHWDVFEMNRADRPRFQAILDKQEQLEQAQGNAVISSPEDQNMTEEEKQQENVGQAGSARQSFKVSDSTIEIIRDLVMLSMITGVNIIDNIRAIRLEESPDNPGTLRPTEAYVLAYNETLVTLEAAAQEKAAEMNATATGATVIA